MHDPSPGTLLRRLGLSSTLLLVGCTSPSALARDDDVEFALKLAERGYEGVANDAVENMAIGADTPERIAAAAFARSELLSRAALLGANDDGLAPAEVRERFSAATRAFESFLESFAGHPRATDAELSMSNLMTKFGYYLAGNLDGFEPGEREGVLAEARRTFDDAIRYLTTIRDREQAKVEEAMVSREPAEEEDRPYYRRNLAWLYLCQAMHDRANLGPVGDALRVPQFTRAIDETTALLEQTDGGIFGYHATMWLGLEHWHRAERPGGKWESEDVRAAADWLKTVMDQVDCYPGIDDPQRGWPDLAKVIHESAVRYGEMANQVRTVDGIDYRKAYVEACTKLERKLPSTKSQYNGLRALVQKGIALAGIGRHVEAVNTLRAASVAASGNPTWGRFVDEEAQRAEERIAAGGR